MEYEVRGGSTPEQESPDDPQATLAYLNSDPRSWAIINDPELHRSMVDWYFTQCKPAEYILERIGYSAYGEELFNRLVRKYHRDNDERWRSLADAVLTMDEEWWQQDNVRPETVVKNFYHGGYTAIRALVCSAHVLRLTDPKHPLFGRVSPDRYWGDYIEDLVRAGRYEHAWSMLVEAARGQPIQGQCPPGLLNRQNCREGRTLYVSVATVKALADYLFEEMAREGILVPSDIMPKERVRPTRWVRVYNAYREVAGWSIACLFRKQKGWEGAVKRRPHIFNKTGAKVLRIAEYYRHLNAKRKKRRRPANASA